MRNWVRQNGLPLEYYSAFRQHRVWIKPILLVISFAEKRRSNDSWLAPVLAQLIGYGVVNNRLKTVERKNCVTFSMLCVIGRVDLR